MVLVKILKRKDASSVLLAIVIAMLLQQPLVTMTGKPASIISGLSNSNQGYGYFGPGGGWKEQYLFPVVWFLVQIVALEVLAWVVILLGWAAKKSMKK